jgi:hypothetical protein
VVLRNYAATVREIIRQGRLFGRECVEYVMRGGRVPRLDDADP